MIRRLLLVFCLISAALAAAPDRAAAQNPDTITGVADTIPRESRVPRNAFIRAMLVPGWGHLYIGEPKRAAVYVALQGASWFMLVKTMGRLSDARDSETALEALGRDSVLAEMAEDTALARRLSDTALFDQAVATYPGLSGARDLVTSRERHRQDWIVYLLFFTFASAVDAYVTAHLKDFPVDVTTSRAPDGAFTVGVQLRLGARQP